MKYIFLSILFILLSRFSNGQNTGFLDFNGYYDTRNESVMTLNILANMENRFQYFSLTNFQGHEPSSELEDLYSEQNIRWRVRDTSSFDLTLQYVLRGGAKNDDWRLGFRWTVTSFKPVQAFFKKINFRYSVNPMMIQFRESTDPKFLTLIEHVYRLNIAPKKLNNRLYIGGFWDEAFGNVDGKLIFNHVSEHQLGIRVYKELYAVTEFRINTFLPYNNIGLGYGLEYKIKF